jgi:hypothetical protein
MDFADFTKEGSTPQGNRVGFKEGNCSRLDRIIGEYGLEKSKLVGMHISCRRSKQLFRC